jgi:hypothetical protein
MVDRDWNVVSLGKMANSKRFTFQFLCQASDALRTPQLLVNMDWSPEKRDRERENEGGKSSSYLCEISSSHGGEYDVQSCLLGCTAV